MKSSFFISLTLLLFTSAWKIELECNSTLPSGFHCNSETNLVEPDFALDFISLYQRGELHFRDKSYSISTNELEENALYYSYPYEIDKIHKEDGKTYKDVLNAFILKGLGCEDNTLHHVDTGIYSRSIIPDSITPYEKAISIFERFKNYLLSLIPFFDF